MDRRTPAPVNDRQGCERLRGLVAGPPLPVCRTAAGFRLEQVEQLPADPPQLVRHIAVGQVGTGGEPLAHRGQPPALRLIGEPSDQHPQQAWATRRTAPIQGGPLQPQLHQQGTALQPGTPAREVQGEVEGLLLVESPGEGIVPPGVEIGAGGGELLAELAHHRGDGRGQLHGSCLISRIHAVFPEQNCA